MNDADAIRALRLAWNAGIASGDAERAMGPIAADAILIPAGGKPLVGRGAIRRAWQVMLRGPEPVHFVRCAETVAVASDRAVAAESGRWTGAGLAGRYLAEWRRGAGGWQCTRELYVESGAP